MTVRRLALYATALAVGFAVGFTLRYGQLTVERRDYDALATQHNAALDELAAWEETFPMVSVSIQRRFAQPGAMN